MTDLQKSIQESARETVLSALAQQNARFALYREQDPTFRESDVNFWTDVISKHVGAVVEQKDAQIARFSQIADERHDLLSAERRARDEARELYSKALTKIAAQEARLAEIKAEITCGDCKQVVTVENCNKHGFGRC